MVAFPPSQMLSLWEGYHLASLHNCWYATTIKDDTVIPATFKLAGKITELVYDCYKFQRAQSSI